LNGSDNASLTFGNVERHIDQAGAAIEDERVVRPQLVVTQRPIEQTDLFEGLLGRARQERLAVHHRQLFQQRRCPPRLVAGRVHPSHGELCSLANGHRDARGLPLILDARFVDLGGKVALIAVIALE
jgi:hypothetical protein